MFILRSSRGYIYIYIYIYIYTHTIERLIPGTSSRVPPLTRATIVWSRLAFLAAEPCRKPVALPTCVPPRLLHNSIYSQLLKLGLLEGEGGLDWAGESVLCVRWQLGCSCVPYHCHCRQVWLLSWNSGPGALSVNTISEAAFQQGLWTYSK